MNASGPQWRPLQIANPNVSGLLSIAQAGINNAGEAGRDILTAYDDGQKRKNDAAVAQELAGINSPEEMQKWLQDGGINGRNVSGASLEAMLTHRKTMAAEAARALAQEQKASTGGSRSRSGSRSSRRRSSSGSSSSSGDSSKNVDVSTNALLALALGQNPTAPAPVATEAPSTNSTAVTRPNARPTSETPASSGPAPFVPGATSTETVTSDFSSLSDEDLAAEIAALGG